MLVVNICQLYTIAHFSFRANISYNPLLLVRSSHESGSYKDKLVGDMPGAFAQAFNLHEDASDLDSFKAEVEEISDGIASVKLSSSSKRLIRGRWAHAIIIKPSGRSVGFHFLHSRIMALWKPVERLECIDLEMGFYLIRFGLVEDLDKVMKEGLWFIGDQFLSIRPWTPNFIPVNATCKSMAVWAHLPQLPIEYYEPSVLKEIGKAVGLVLRIDAQTATESRGRYAKICVQVNLNNPLIRTILIGRLVQAVVYEGISTLCFSCGRVGHNSEACPYTIKAPTSKCQMEDTDGQSLT